MLLFIYYCIIIILYFIFCTARLIASMNIFVQRVTETSSVFFWKNILFYNVIIYIIIYYCIVISLYSIFCTVRLTVSMNIFVQRVTETSNVFFSKHILFYNVTVYIVIYYCIIIILYCIFSTARLIASMNIFVQKVTETSSVFFSNSYFLNWLTGYFTL